MHRLTDGCPAGRPLRVTKPRGADQKCLNRIALTLAKQGFNELLFVDPPPAP